MENVAFSWGGPIFVLGIMTIFATVAVIVIWQVLATWRARMSVAREEAYRNIAEQATEAQRRTADEIGKATTELAELRRRTAELERMLKEVG